MDYRRVEPPLPHRERPANVIVDTLVLHSTVTGTAEEAVRVLRARELSYHALGGKDGRILECCPIEKVAHHGGNSYGPREETAGISREQNAQHMFIANCSVNDYTVSFSFANMNDGVDPYTEPQLVAALEWIEMVRCTYPLLWLTTHGIVSPGRKNDPLGLDLDAFAARCGLKVWRPKPSE